MKQLQIRSTGEIMEGARAIPGWELMLQRARGNNNETVDVDTDVLREQQNLTFLLGKVVGAEEEV